MYSAHITPRPVTRDHVHESKPFPASLVSLVSAEAAEPPLPNTTAASSGLSVNGFLFPCTAHAASLRARSHASTGWSSCHLSR